MEWTLFIFLLLLVSAVILNRYRVKKMIALEPIILTKPDSFHRKVEVFLQVSMILWWIQLFVFSLPKNWIDLTFIPNMYLPFFIFEPLGYLLLYAGLFIIASALYTLGKSWRIGIDEKNAGPLVTKGLYQYIRHPIYTGLFVILSGSLFILPNLLTFFLALCAATGTATEAYLEEQFLLSKFGDVYKSYMIETSRFIPKNFL